MESTENTIQTKPAKTSQKHQNKAEILVRNFVSQYRRPFSLQTIESYTGITIRKLQPIINKLIIEHLIKIVSCDPEPLYVKTNRYCPIGKVTSKERWNFDPEKALIIINEIKNNKHKGVRSIGKAIGKSRQWVYLYLEALASVGKIKKENGCYTAILVD